MVGTSPAPKVIHKLCTFIQAVTRAVVWAVVQLNFLHKHPHRLTKTPNARSMVMRVLRRRGREREEASLVIDMKRNRSRGDILTCKRGSL